MLATTKALQIMVVDRTCMKGHFFDHVALPARILPAIAPESLHCLLAESLKAIVTTIEKNHNAYKCCSKCNFAGD